MNRFDFRCRVTRRTGSGVLLAVILVAGISCGERADRPPAANASIPVVEGFAPVYGAELYYQVSGEGEPVVLIHGGNTHLGMWDDQFAELARHFRVVRYDVRGYGRSEATGEKVHAPWDDLRRLLAHLGIERTHIVGLSLGGRIAIDFALEDPEKVDRLVLAGPGLSGWQFETSDWMEELSAAIEAGDGRAATEAWLSSPYLTALMEHPALADRMRQLSIESEHSWFSEARAARLVPPAIDRLSELHAPALLILGDRDVQDIHEIIAMIAEQAPDTEMLVLEGAGHMVNMERPEEFNRAVLEFLTR